LLNVCEAISVENVPRGCHSRVQQSQQLMYLLHHISLQLQDDSDLGRS
jgi:hypothetical protein